jgi:hypothetical protein
VLFRSIAEIFAGSLILLFPWIISIVKDKSESEIETYKSENVIKAKERYKGMLLRNRGFEYWDFSDGLKMKLREYIRESWEASVNEYLDKELIKKYKELYDTLKNASIEFSREKLKYINVINELSGKLSESYQNKDANLEALAEASDTIKNEAILPSFCMLENKRIELKEKIDILSSIPLVCGTD